jgi:hypothetical protein
MIGNYIYEYFGEQGKPNSHMDYPIHLGLSVRIKFQDNPVLLREFSYLTCLHSKPQNAWPPLLANGLPTICCVLMSLPTFCP